MAREPYGFHQLSACRVVTCVIAEEAAVHESNLPKVKPSRDDERASEGSLIRK